jgi:methionyl-tRNA formyltransferase
MNYAFFGSPRYAALILDALCKAGYIPSVLVCNPDRPVGRKQVITAPQTKQLIAGFEEDARKRVAVFQAATKQELAALKDEFVGCEFAVVAAYSKIIPPDVIGMFPKGVIGVHPSLLPNHRGPSPIQAAILGQDAETGVTLYLVDEKVDHGPLLADRAFPIADFDITYAELEEKLARLGGDLLVKTLPDFLAGKIVPREQDHARATICRKLATDDGFVDIEKDNPNAIFRKVRALNPEPGVFAFIEGVRTKLLAARREKDGSIVVTQILPEGRNPRGVRIVLGH